MGRVQERIYREIFPKSYKDAKVEEFYRLEQGDSSFLEYEKKFSELIRLVPFFAENEQEKINIFMASLNPAVRTIVTSASHTKYGQLVEASTRVDPSRPSRTPTGRPRSQAARVYTVTQPAADATPDVVTGTISLIDTDALVLVDSGATHSFISREFIERVEIEMRPTECSIILSLPTGNLLIANKVYRGSKVTIASHEFEADLIVLDIHDFDIILGMDWLAKHRLLQERGPF